MANFRSINRFMLQGRVGMIGEMKHGKAPRQTDFLSLSLATTEVYRGGKKRTIWHRVTVWGKSAEFAEKFVHVGDQIYVEGKISYNFYNDEDGEKRKAYYFNVEEIQLMHQSYKNRQEYPYGNKDEEEESEEPEEDSEDNDEPPF